MEYLSSEKILIIDLESSEVTEEELTDELVEEKIGGAGINKYLFEQYEDDDPIVFGTGLLTGTLYPASAAGIITAKSPRTGQLSHFPVTLKNAIELKYSGFDYLVIKGSSDKPVFLWIHDGVADISDASDVWGKNTWETTDKWRQDLGEDLIQTLLIGEAGEQGSDYAQVILNYWGSADQFGIGKLFGEKNLKGIALRGMGLLEIADPEEFVDQSFEILNEVKDGAFKGKQGIPDLLAEMGEDVQDWLSPLVHRHSACYNTPYPTNTFVYLDTDPSMLEETDNPEPGLLLTDAQALLAAKQAGLSAEEACRFLKSCAQYGVDGLAAAKLCSEAGKDSLEAMTSHLSELSGEVPLPGNGLFSPWAPQKPLFADFGLSDEQEIAAWWERRQALAYIFGLHPIFVLMSPELKAENMLELVNTGTELELDQETLDSVIADLTE
jgi:aldehyde:ferredoxin oxidoreductase